MDHFTPYSALAGGVLIGLSAALLMLLNGRIAGISGILGGAVSLHGGDRKWRWYFIAGLFLGPMLLRLVGVNLAAVQINVPLVVIVMAGLLVGYGTGLGNGCTSGHGVCGLARLSPRSAAATVTFMLSAGITVYIVRHLIGGF